MAKKQKSGLYRTKVKIGVDANGKDIFKYISARTMRELEDLKREVVAQYIERKAAAQDVLFGAYAVEWFRVIKAPGLSASSIESYRTALNKDILPIFSNFNLRAITAMQLQDFINGYAGKSATKITMICATLKGIFESACADRIITENPMEHIRKPKPTPPEEKIALTIEQRERIEAECRSNPRALYLALMYYLGLRPGEARGLQWGDIDWQKNTVHIQRDIDYKDGGKVGDVKTQKSKRIVPLPDGLRAILSGLRGMPDLFIVRGEKGGALSKTSAERLWVELMYNCEMVESAENVYYRESDIRSKWRPIITPHAIRHNYATMCWEAGIDAYTTMRLMGHASIKTTMDIYTHLNDRQMDRIAEKVEIVFDNSERKVAQKLHKPKFGGTRKN